MGDFSLISNISFDIFQDGKMNNTISFPIPFIDQKAANVVKRQLNQLNKKLNSDLQPLFKSRKLEEILKCREEKPPLVNQQLVPYNFQCDLCDASYVGYTSRHKRIEEHKRIKEHRYSTIGKNRLGEHGLTTAPPRKNFTILKKCQTNQPSLLTNSKV